MSYLLAIVLHLESPQWGDVPQQLCVLKSILVPQCKSKQRLIGTILGVALGLLANNIYLQNYIIFNCRFIFLFDVNCVAIYYTFYTIYTLFFTFSFVLMMFFTPSLGYNVAFVRIEDVVRYLIGTLGSFISMG